MKDERRAPFPDAHQDIETWKTTPDTPQITEMSDDDLKAEMRRRAEVNQG